MISKPYLRIAAEEAFCPPEMLDIYRGIVDEGALDDPGFLSQWGYFLNSDSERSAFVRQALCCLDEGRLADMDAAGIDKAIIALTSPGVQVMPKEQAVSFAAYANDVLADGVSRHPDRYFGLTAVAPRTRRRRPRRWSAAKASASRASSFTPTPEPVHGRCQALAHLRGRRSLGHAHLHAPEHAVQGHGGATHRTGSGRLHLRLRRRNGSPIF